MYLEKIDHLLDAMYTVVRQADERERHLLSLGYKEDSQEVLEAVDIGYAAIDDIEKLVYRFDILFNGEANIKKNTIKMLVMNNSVKKAIDKNALDKGALGYTYSAIVNESISQLNSSNKYFQEDIKSAIDSINDLFSLYISEKRQFMFADPDNFKEVINTLSGECLDYSVNSERIHQADVLNHGDVNGEKAFEMNKISEGGKELVKSAEEIQELYSEFMEDVRLDKKKGIEFFDAINAEKALINFDSENVLYLVKDFNNLKNSYVNGIGVFYPIIDGVKQNETVEAPFRYYGSPEGFFMLEADYNDLIQKRSLDVDFEHVEVDKNGQIRPNSDFDMSDAREMSHIREKHGYRPSNSDKERRESLEEAIKGGCDPYKIYVYLKHLLAGPAKSPKWNKQYSENLKTDIKFMEENEQVRKHLKNQRKIEQSNLRTGIDRIDRK